MNSITFGLSYWKVMDKPTFCMFKIQMTNASSSFFVSTPCRPTFLVLVLPLRWFDSKVKRMFQYLLAFFKEVCLHFTTSMAFSSCWFVHLPCLDTLGNLLFFFIIVVLVMVGWGWCFCDVVANWDYPIYCFVEVGYWFSWVS